MVLGNVPQEFEQSESVEYQEEAGEHDREIVEELLEQIDVDYHWESNSAPRLSNAAVERGGLRARNGRIGCGRERTRGGRDRTVRYGDGRHRRWPYRAVGDGRGRDARLADWTFPKTDPKKFEPLENLDFSKALEAQEEQESNQGRGKICGPDACPGGDPALPGHVIPRDPQEVIAANEHKSQDHARGASAAAWTDSDRHAQQGEDQTSCRESDAVFEFDARIKPGGAAIGEKCRNVLLGLGGRNVFRCSRRARDVDGDVAVTEGGHVVA